MPPNDKNAFYAKQQAERDRANADRDKQAKAKQEIMQAFKVFDLNHDGVVSHGELVRILMRPTGSDAMTKEAAKAFINKFEAYDRNGDGVLNIDEFATALAASGIDLSASTSKKTE